MPISIVKTIRLISQTQWVSLIQVSFGIVWEELRLTAQLLVLHFLWMLQDGVQLSLAVPLLILGIKDPQV